jgi:hypothetical protein
MWLKKRVTEDPPPFFRMKTRTSQLLLDHFFHAALSVLGADVLVDAADVAVVIQIKSIAINCDLASI